MRAVPSRETPAKRPVGKIRSPRCQLWLLGSNLEYDRNEMNGIRDCQEDEKADVLKDMFTHPLTLNRRIAELGGLTKPVHCLLCRSGQQLR